MFTESQKKKLYRLAKVADNGEIVLLDEISQLDEKVDLVQEDLLEKTQNLESKINQALIIAQETSKQKGIDGYTPKKGVDYQDGESYILTAQDKKEIAKTIKVPVVNQILKEIKVIEKPIVTEVTNNIENPFILTGNEIVSKINALTDDDEKIDSSKIKNLDVIDRKTLDDEIKTLQNRTQLLIQIATQRNTSTTPSVGSTFQVPTAGDVDGANTQFEWATAPNVVVVDNGNTMQKVSSDGTVNWTGTTTTLLTVPPNREIFSIA